MSEKWFSLGLVEDTELLARPWVAGDGVQCSFAGAQRREPCGPPVAVLETVRYRKEWAGGRYAISNTKVEKRIERVCCAEHLAGRIGRRFGNDRSHMINRATKRATDEVVTKHWKQYQAAYEKALADERAKLFAGFPEHLQEILLAARMDGDDE